MEIAPHPGGCFAKTARNDKKLNIQGLSRIEVKYSRDQGDRPPRFCEDREGGEG